MRILVHGGFLSTLMIVALGNGTWQRAEAAEPFLEKRDLFEAGTGGYGLYRIPTIISTRQGTVLAFCEARKTGGGDWGAIDIFMRRSTDGGESWSKPVKIVTPPDNASQNPVSLSRNFAQPGDITVNNPVAIADQRTGVVHFLYCVEYARCFYMRSADDGQTWSAPREITSTFEKFRNDMFWKVIATGPGHGIQLKNGRLIVPVWISTGTGVNAHRPSLNSVIYSDDNGNTWNRGHIVAGQYSPRNPSETGAVQLADGRVMLNFRHESWTRGRAKVLSFNGATEWTPVEYEPALPEPICMASILRLSERGESGRNRLLFSNPNNPIGRQRRNLSIRLSYDEGFSWPVSKSLESGTSGYSDLAVTSSGTILCFYERGSVNERHTAPASLCVARFNLEWLTEGIDSLDD